MGMLATARRSEGGDYINTAKIETLKSNGSYNRHASAVTSPLFMGNTHFDPYDLVQVKYEMLRAVMCDEMTITEASRQFGFSRAAYYKIEKSFDVAGVNGLFLQKTGPKAAVKATDEILQFADELREHDPSITNDRIVEEIHKQKGVTLHKRSLQRERSKKKHSRARNDQL
jgi:transposase